MPDVVLARSTPLRAVAAVMYLLIFGGVNSVHAANVFSIALEQDADRTHVVVRGAAFSRLADSVRSELADWPLAKWHGVLEVEVLQNPDRPAPAMLGSYKLLDSELHFSPRFSLKPGLQYQATFRPSAITSALANTPELREILTVPNVEPEGPTRVLAIYPTSDRLPANLLKLYVQFSAPVRQGAALQHVRLTTSDGLSVDDAFVNVGQELWDTTGTRLTLLLDPGRIKQGLRPRSEIGPVLQTGKCYQLTIADSWRDANGQPLAAEFTKHFSVTSLDQAQPDPTNWQISKPSAGSLETLQIKFDEPLDFAFAQHAITVVSAQNEAVSGIAQVSEAEQLWTFTPNYLWPAGEYSLVVDGRLEDLAANSVGRPFETPIDSQGNSPAAKAHVTLPLQIR